MKRIVNIIMIMTMLGSLVGCGQQTMQCTFCEEEKVCETKVLLGEEVHICEECLDEMEGL